MIRKHQLRPTDFRTGKRLGKEDHLVMWVRPARPSWMTEEQYLRLPDTLTLREVRVRVSQPGMRTKSLLVVTTLLDAQRYSAEEIASLYRRRWQAELHFRSIKVVLQMDHLRCKTPKRVRNEFYMHLVGYNLNRGVMAAAAEKSGACPWEISFKGTLQTLSQFLPLLQAAAPESWCEALLTAVAVHIVGDRPDRFEPRRIKRRPKHYLLLQKPRPPLAKASSPLHKSRRAKALGKFKCHSAQGVLQKHFGQAGTCSTFPQRMLMKHCVSLNRLAWSSPSVYYGDIPIPLNRYTN